MRKIMIAVLLISVLSLSSFYAVSAEERGYKVEYADIPSVGRTLKGVLSTNNGTQYGVASSSTYIEPNGCCNIILTAKLDVRDRQTGQSLIGNEQVAYSAPGGNSVSTSFSFVAQAVTVFTTHDASPITDPLTIQLILNWPN